MVETAGIAVIMEVFSDVRNELLTFFCCQISSLTNDTVTSCAKKGVVIF